MLWPNKLNEAHGPRISTRHRFPSVEVKRSSAAESKVLAVGIQGYGDIRLRGGHQVDRQSFLLEDLECIRQKAHLMPHARALHGNQGDAFLDRDGFDLRGAVGDVRGHDRAFESRRLRGVHMQRNLVLPHRQDAARMQDLCAVAGNFLGFVVVQGAQQPRGRHGARIGAEHAGHVGPNLEARSRAVWPQNTHRRCPIRRGPAAPSLRHRSPR